jgi:hypothetical protein
MTPDVSSTIAATFGAFDGITYAMMAIIVVGAAYMMPGVSAVITATTGALFVFAFSIFLRAMLASGGATATVARDDWNYLLALPLGMLLVYAAVFGFSITAVHALRMAAKQ